MSKTAELFEDNSISSKDRDSLNNCCNLSTLKNLVENLDTCALKQSANKTVFSDGNPNSKIMLVGEAPGLQEDIEGRPFCGRSGQLLDKMLNAIGLNRDNVYITNTIFWRPPGNRKPTSSETEICRPFLEKHIALINPDLLIMVGSVAVSVLFPQFTMITKIRGQFHPYKNVLLKAPIYATALFHPAYLLRQPQQKKLAWEDLKVIKQYIDSHNIL